MRKIETGSPTQEQGGTRKMGRKKERMLSDEEVFLLNNLVGAGVHILRNKNLSVDHPEFQEEKKAAIRVVLSENGITSNEQEKRLWPSLASRIELAMKIPPEEHFQKKRMKKLQESMHKPDDPRTKGLLEIARELISISRKKGRTRKATADMVRDAVYQTIRHIKYKTKQHKEAEAKLLKYYLCGEYQIPTNDPGLKSLSDPDRQKELFVN